MQQRYFITSTGTGIGKTFITAAMVRQARQLGQSIAAYKPIISGFDPSDMSASDTGLLLQSLELHMTPENIDRISPWRYSAPLAPSMAGRLENRPIDFHALVSHSQEVTEGKEDVILIEGVGGVMVPLNERRTVLDWIEALGIPIILVVGNYLGSISHTLTTLSVLRQRHIPIHTIVVNESETATVSMDMTIQELQYWTEAKILPVFRRSDSDWHNVSELQNLLQAA